ncbi:D-inositol-3-phosphate glycosyltransferase [Luteipulveratus mongoliensis]|uniref:D-inositol-3-phosphate glycosyltransferase n=1 Tax=Luteipulveratus mongoliensis TaxID=571913 RepID=A0A0K1JG68_9MICO|nr:D-inositol-3-phosphate glycosyltransferase [Luteipulveratus mongoliensis]AKU15697.1 D-inositol 3-phosphate glycosyltransferase [Luteipulveratus mongoliensis]
MSVQPCPRRVAMISVHTSPLERPGTGDAGGLNVYVVETAKHLARAGVEVEVFTRRTTAAQPESVELMPGVLVRHIDAGPFEGLGKDDLPGQLCAFTVGVQRIGAAQPEGYYDLVHSHYWLSGQVAWLAADRWQVPLVHSMHTMARVKNALLAEGDRPEPPGREIGEEQVVRAATWLVANTDREADELIDLYDAAPDKVRVISPGVDLETFTPGEQAEARAALDLPADAEVLLFVGRIQPLKAPDVLVRAAAHLLEQDPGRRDRLVVAVLGGPSGSGLDHPEALADLVDELGLGDVVRLVPPVSRDALAQWYRAADLLAVPSYNESFGLVAIEAQACGTPVVAAAVGGLPTAVGDGGVLLDTHDPKEWGAAIAELLDDPARRRAMSAAALTHAAAYGWQHTTDQLLELYRAACHADSSASPKSQHLTGVPAAVIP